jgi:manganese-dependent inorganic pyrophosphatase
MSVTYVVGHRNPDTDSIVSAMAYAELRRALGENDVKAARLGEVNKETNMILKRFGFDAPPLLHTVKTQISDLEFDHPPVLSASVTVQKAWEAIHSDAANKSGSIPIANDEGHLFGMVSTGDIATHDIQTASSSMMEPTTVFNLISTIEGQLINEGDSLAPVLGPIIIAVPTVVPMEKRIARGSVVICGAQEEIIHLAVEAGANCVIVCEADVPQSVRQLETSTRIIATPCDIYRVLRLIPQSIPVARICQTENVICFDIDSFLDDVREVMLQSRHRCYPVTDAGGAVLGTISRYHLIRPRRKRVILVDHNEFSQSVPGLDQAEIIEIIDHHRLADVQTSAPIFFRNEPVGSTSTIVASRFLENGIFPSERMAGLIVSAILSDTVMFKSPTCTDTDIRMAQRMARLAGIDIDELGKEIFSTATAGNETPETLLFTDFKEFKLFGHHIGIGQVSSMNSRELLAKYEAALLTLMQNTSKEKGYDFIMLMLTDIFARGH